MTNRKWASDDGAADLLSSILDETESDAKAEEARIQAEIEAREAEERRKRDEEDARKRQEAEARISAEQDRMNQAAERRTAKMEALKIEDLKARGEWIDPEVVAKKQREAEEQRRRDEEMLARKMAQSQAPVQQVAQAAMPAPEPPKSNTAMYGIAAAALIAVIGGGVAMVVLGGGYKVDNSQYAKAVYKPKDVEIALVDVAVTPIPKAAPAPQVEDEKPTRRRRGSSRKSTKKSAPKSDKVGKGANKKASELEKMLQGGAADPFAL